MFPWEQLGKAAIWGRVDHAQFGRSTSNAEQVLCTGAVDGEIGTSTYYQCVEVLAAF